MKKENLGSVKALKKQLGAAVAMVCVAAVALGSSTYAWFVSNNTVKGTTTAISAQSNAPFLKIDDKTVTAASGTEKTLETSAATTELYPVQVVGKNGDGSAKFASAYASSKDAATELTGSRFDVGNVEAAKIGKYVLEQTFYIGTSDTLAGSFKNLTVSGVKINATAGSKLESAMRVLVVGEDGWVVWKQGDNATTGWVKQYNNMGTNTDIDGFDAEGSLDDEIEAGKSGIVKVYVFYDGADDEVYTKQLEDLKKGCGVTISFTATPVNTDGNNVTNANNTVSDANAPKN